jgi:lysyl-tRNA synthetase, class II
MPESLDHIIPDNDQTRARRAHLEALRALVGNAYPNRFARTNVCQSAEGEDTISSLVARFKSHEPLAAEGTKPTAEQLEAANAELNRVEVRVSGRVATPPRVMGKAAFVHLSDGRERLQIYLRRDDARAVSNDTGAVIDDGGSGWRLLQLLDHGDFVGVAGFLFVTKTGELSVHVREIQFLAKALVPMPDKVHGISDPETGRRMRYADLIASSLKVEREPRELTTREVFERRSRLITEMRRFLDSHGYVEVETPMLSPIASGAAARPFKTYHNALGIDLYARIAPELYLKRLLVGGFERVYELNRNFRNEGVGYRWNPEFTMLEFYCAYMDVNGMMDFCEEMLRTTVEAAIGSTRIHYEDAESTFPRPGVRTMEGIDFGRPFRRLTMKQAISERLSWDKPGRWYSFNELLGERFDDEWLDDAKRTAALAHFCENWHRRFHDEAPDVTKQHTEPREIDAGYKAISRQLWQEALAVASSKPQPDESDTARHVADIFEIVAEPYLIKPTFITDFPKPISPLSKASPADPSVAERFELYVAGMEVANGFSELNDPVEQYERFEEQTRQRERGDEEAMQMDEDYIRALSYGMPPAAGIGIGIDRLVMLLTNRKSIRDVILFPHMRPVAQKQEEGEERDEVVHRLDGILDELAEGDEESGDEDAEPRAGLRELRDELDRHSPGGGRGDEQQ